MTVAKRATALAAAALTLLPAASAFAQCAMCRATLENSPDAMAKSAELNQAILLLFVAPYLVASTLTLALFRRRIVTLLRPRFTAAIAAARASTSLFAPR